MIIKNIKVGMLIYRKPFGSWPFRAKDFDSDDQWEVLKVHKWRGLVTLKNPNPAYYGGGEVIKDTLYDYWSAEEYESVRDELLAKEKAESDAKDARAEAALAERLSRIAICKEAHKQGAIIQRFVEGKSWNGGVLSTQTFANDTWHDVRYPRWKPNCIYRVKPGWGVDWAKKNKNRGQ